MVTAAITAATGLESIPTGVIQWFGSPPQPAGSSATAMSSPTAVERPVKTADYTALHAVVAGTYEVPANSQTCRAPSSAAGPAKTPLPDQAIPWWQPG